MPYRLPAHLTTATNPWPLACYIATIYLGLINVTGLQQARALGEWLGLTTVGAWGAARAVGGILGLCGAMLAMRALRTRADPCWWLGVEFVGCLHIAATSTLYAISIIRANGPLAVMETTGLAAAFAIGATWRGAQIPGDILRWKRATRLNRPAEPAPLADPR